MKQHQSLTFDNVNALVVGDVVLDRYWSGATERISPEAPVPVIHIKNDEDRAGGAANVALNMRALGANITLQGMVGNDDAAKQLTAQLEKAGVCCDMQVVNAPTIIKLRVLSRHQQILRLDFEQPFAELSSDSLLSNYARHLNNTDVVVLSDYGKGTLAQTASFIKAAKAKQIPVLVDPKGTDFSHYRGATVITPNFKEFTTIVGECSQPSVMVEKGQQLMDELDIEYLVVTRGEQGMSMLQHNAAPVHLSTSAREVFDVTGAGDTVVASLALALAKGLPIAEAAHVANTAAGIVVAKLGTATASLHELNHALTGENHDFMHGVLDLKSFLPLRAALQVEGKRLVMTNGCFDLLHRGHVSVLNQAKQLGDYLLVAVNSDESVKQLKGPERPLNTLSDRMELLAGLRAVDWVIPFSQQTPAALIEQIIPDVLVKGGDYLVDDIAGAKTVLAHGGDVKVLPFVDGYSTTNMVAQMRKQREKV